MGNLCPLRLQRADPSQRHYQVPLFCLRKLERRYLLGRSNPGAACHKRIAVTLQPRKVREISEENLELKRIFEKINEVPIDRKRVPFDQYDLSLEPIDLRFWREMV